MSERELLFNITMSIHGKILLLAAVGFYFLIVKNSVVGQTTNSTATNSTNGTRELALACKALPGKPLDNPNSYAAIVCNGTILVITLPARGYPWFFGYPPFGKFPQPLGLPLKHRWW